jgi:predicted alpha/beta-hydrolase family hydrolase
MRTIDPSPTGQNTGMALARTLLAILALAMFSLSLAEDKSVKITWGGAKQVTAVFSYPPNRGKLPIILIASGRSGGMNTPVVKGLADKAVRDGIVAVRFEYAYFTAKGEPSKGLVDETEQFKAVVTAALKDPRIDPKRVVIAGKSLGSVVAHRVFQLEPTYAGEVLLTPVIPTVDDANRLYPNLPLAGRPTAIVVGNSDTDNAPLGVVYNYLRDASRKVMLNVVAGDHGYWVSEGKDDAGRTRNAANTDMALEVAEYWVRQMARVWLSGPPHSSAPKGDVNLQKKPSNTKKP